MPWGSMAKEMYLTMALTRSPPCREREEPRRAGSLGRKSDHVMTPWAGETMGYRDMHWGAEAPRQEIGDQREGAWAHICNGLVSCHWLSQATSTSLAILAHLCIFECAAHSYLCVFLLQVVS